MEAQHKSRKEEHEMLVASYDFDATIPQTLSFKKDDNFIFHSTNNIKKNWWSIIDAHGKVGYIPSNYVSIVKIKKGKMIDFINTAIENLSADISKAGGSDKQLEAMKELILRKQETLQKRSRSRDNSEKREKLSCSKSLPDSDSVHSTGEDGADGSSPKPATAPLVMRVSVSESKFPSSEGQSSSESRSESASQQITKKRRAPPAPDNSSGSYQSLESVLRLADSPEAPHSKKTSSGDVSSQSIYLLVHQVRNQTGLSHDSARIATGVVVEGLLDILPSEASGSLESFLELLHANVPPPESVYDDTQDAIELRGIISHLRTAREDAQQRSWHLWDDEDSIQQHIGALSSILKNADPAISRRVLRQGNYDDIMMLVDYYQMEERVCIRQLLIDTFAVLCGLDEVIISTILNSVLPMELAREMQSNRNKCSEIEKQAMLLAYIFSLGEAMPITHLDHLGCDFITMVLEIIESDSAADIDDAMVMLILSYNLQFKPKSSTNITLQALSEMESAKNFTEKIMLLINREEDPIQRLDVHHPPYHSVLKLLKDVFFSPSTAKLFYTNDIKVLIEIILRQMTNLAPNSKQRTEYLELCRLVLFSCEDATFEHRLSELKLLFNYIINEEAPGVPQDKNIARQVIEGLPQHFGCCRGDDHGNVVLNPNGMYLSLLSHLNQLKQLSWPHDQQLDSEWGTFRQLPGYDM